VPNQVEPLDGISLVPLLEGAMKERPRPIGFWQGYGQLSAKVGRAAWNDNRYKLVRPAGDKYEFYDLAVDPSEEKDLAAEHPEIVKRMKAELQDWQESVIRSSRGEDYNVDRLGGATSQQR
jgi:arylsulfatase A-like enzyme